jgi:hypothetical protein
LELKVHRELVWKFLKQFERLGRHADDHRLLGLGMDGVSWTGATLQGQDAGCREWHGSDLKALKSRARQLKVLVNNRFASTTKPVLGRVAVRSFPGDKNYQKISHACSHALSKVVTVPLLHSYHIFLTIQDQLT